MKNKGGIVFFLVALVGVVIALFYFWKKAQDNGPDDTPVPIVVTIQIIDKQTGQPIQGHSITTLINNVQETEIGTNVSRQVTNKTWIGISISRLDPSQPAFEPVPETPAVPFQVAYDGVNTYYSVDAIFPRLAG